jgi:hypothetical protein
MTDEQKKLILKYMGWKVVVYNNVPFISYEGTDHISGFHLGNY